MIFILMPFYLAYCFDSISGFWLYFPSPWCYPEHLADCHKFVSVFGIGVIISVFLLLCSSFTFSSSSSSLLMSLTNDWLTEKLLNFYRGSRTRTRTYTDTCEVWLKKSLFPTTPLLIFLSTIIPYFLFTFPLLLFYTQIVNVAELL